MSHERAYRTLCTHVADDLLSCMVKTITDLSVPEPESSFRAGKQLTSWRDIAQEHKLKPYASANMEPHRVRATLHHFDAECSICNQSPVKPMALKTRLCSAPCAIALEPSSPWKMWQAGRFGPAGKISERCIACHVPIKSLTENMCGFRPQPCFCDQSPAAAIAGQLHQCKSKAKGHELRLVSMLLFELGLLCKEYECLKPRCPCQTITVVADIAPDANRQVLSMTDPWQAQCSRNSIAACFAGAACVASPLLQVTCCLDTVEPQWRRWGCGEGRISAGKVDRGKGAQTCCSSLLTSTMYCQSSTRADESGTPNALSALIMPFLMKASVTPWLS